MRKAQLEHPRHRSLACSSILLVAPAQAGTWTAVHGGDNIHYYSADLVDASHAWVGGVTFIPPGSARLRGQRHHWAHELRRGATWEYSTSHQGR